MTPEELKLAQTIYRRILDDSADNLDRNEGWLAYGLMLKHIDDQAAQIAALKKLLIEERAERLHKQRSHDHYDDMITDADMAKAREQLKAKYPEAMK